jgi:drug/metabolite transporter (DMT)-like permease
MKPVHLVSLLVMNFFWSAVYSAYKVVGHDLPTGGIVTLRFGLAALSFLVVWPWLPGAAPRGRDLCATCLLGVMLYVGGQRLQVYGNSLGMAGNSAALMSIEPLLTSVGAALILREHLGPRRLAGFALGILGVAMINGVWRADFRWSGMGASMMLLLSFACESAYSVFGKPITQRFSVMKMLAISLLVGTLVNLLIDGSSTMTAAKSLTPKAWGLLLMLALLCTTFGYTLWFVVIRDCPISVAALTVFAQSVFGVGIAALWLGEKARWEQLAGSLTIVSGLILGLSRQVKRTKL